MSKSDADSEARIPLTEEQLKVRKHVVETGRVTLQNCVEEEEQRIRDTLEKEHVRVERVPADKLMDDPPQMREETDRLVVPVFEEVVVKRYRLLEEVHLIKKRSSEPFDETVTLRRNRVNVERS